MKALMFVVPVLLIGGVVVAAFMGVIKIPGITPKKGAATAAYATDHDDKPVAGTTKPTPAASKPAKTEAPAKSPPKTVKKDPDQGADALATVWNEIDTPELIAMSRTWKDQDLVRVLTHMDNDKVAKFIDELAKGDDDTKLKPDPERASKLSKALQDLGSIVKTSGPGDKTT